MNLKPRKVLKEERFAGVNHISPLDIRQGAASSLLAPAYRQGGRRQAGIGEQGKGEEARGS